MEVRFKIFITIRDSYTQKAYPTISLSGRSNLLSQRLNHFLVCSASDDVSPVFAIAADPVVARFL
jgi:hypothetical protein